MALPKHPEVILTGLGKPEHQTARGPGIGNANGRESMLASYKKGKVFFLL